MNDASRGTRPRIIVDADACPRVVLDICHRVAEERGLSVVTVASFAHDVSSKCHIMVDDGPEAADLRIMNIATCGDVVISQDWGLAAMVLARGASCLNPSGQEYSSKTIDTLLEFREAMSRHRRRGGRTRGPKKREEEDDLRFERCLRKLL
ncbi:MAG: YaiI/YqxD family protein [Bacillota bacterium]